MKLGKFRLGMRTLKTALACMICIIFFNITHRGTPMIACLSAVFALREDFQSTIKFGGARIVGNTVGGLFAVLYYLATQHTNHSIWIELAGIPLSLILIIVFNDGINNNSGIVGSAAAFLTISYNIPANESVVYLFQRILDTFIGAAIAISLNVFVKPATKIERQEVDEDIEELQHRELELIEIRQKLQAKIEKKTPKHKKH
ncbi:MAG: aromatic acid exporter family protein [Streptococcaceae bacterium]|jgi:uncharacterized membrane protein YgaE (UPF0421/DUF939 family)|nr:aromatic acid exporter family protein [Streptococcaceae bacterium]